MGSLNIVATPIGNLEDITLRAIEVLKSVDVILCEDTRVTKKLLDNYKIQKQLISYHQHSDTKKIKDIIDLLSVGKNLALVTDAGTPGISDPGNLLISEILKSNPQINIIPVPGVSAVTTALSISGFPSDKFVFLGFPPHKNKRQKYFKEIAQQIHTVVFYESGHRIKKCLSELEEVVDSNREIVVCRELTKKFESVYRGNIKDIKGNMKEERGEFVIVLNRL